jgi:hypothetical protein
MRGRSVELRMTDVAVPLPRSRQSPDGRWRMLETPEQWVAVRVAGPPRVLSFSGGRLEGWAR